MEQPSVPALTAQTERVESSDSAQHRREALLERFKDKARQDRTDVALMLGIDDD